MLSFLCKIIQLLFEITITGEGEKERHEEMLNNKDNGYDDVKIYLSVDGNEVTGTCYVNDISFSKKIDGGQVLTRFKNYHR